MSRQAGRPPRESEGGVTLIELVVTLGILVTLAGAMHSAQDADFRLVRTARDEGTARRACVARLETLVADRGALQAGERSFPLPGPFSEALPGAEGREVVREVEPGLLEVAVQVDWPSAGGLRRTWKLTTLLAAEGVR